MLDIAEFIMGPLYWGTAYFHGCITLCDEASTPAHKEVIGHMMWSYVLQSNPDSKVHGANMGPTWVLSAPDGPHFGSRNLAIREYM